MSTDIISVADCLKYANLQMAAEAFIRNPKTGDLASDGDLLEISLIEGNGHNSIFPATQATDFAAHWKVPDQEANTSTGFSGTLFLCTVDDPLTGAKAGERVISLRSTEFIDDAARDNEATNTLEIKDFGYAFGQISDMEAWFEKLTHDPALLPADQQISVTGYSLGGHLAAAFNILHGGESTTSGEPLIKEVVTFNGAGVGQVTSSTLSAVMQEFDRLKSGYAGGIIDPVPHELYLRTPGTEQSVDMTAWIRTPQ